MVLAEKGSENARNGRRSRGPSPNGHIVAESTSEDESVPVDKIRVGRDYQAVCPPLQPIETRRPDTLQDRALLVWSPTIDIPETKLDEYITLAKEKYGYNGEQALGMLFWHKHDLERAVLDLANFTPFPDEWSVEDKVLFEQAFQFHGKSFHRIRQMLPDKSIASLVKYYYSWKKTRTRTSLMDKQARKLTTQRDGTTIVGGVVINSGVGGVDGGGGGGATSDGNVSDNGGGGGATTTIVGGGGGGTTTTSTTPGAPSGGNASNDDSDTDDKKWTIHRGIRRKSGSPPHSTVGQSTTTTTTTTTIDNNTTNNNNDTTITTTTSTIKSNLQGEGGVCGNCGVACSLTHLSAKGQQLCHSCHQHWRRTGVARPTSGPGTTTGRRGGVGSIMRHKRRPPRGMYINHDDLVAMAASPHGQLMLRAMDREIISLKRQVQHNKQIISTLKKKTSDGIQELQPNNNSCINNIITIQQSSSSSSSSLLDQQQQSSSSQINSKWTQDELLLAVQGVRKYGKDFKTIADVIGTKTESHLKSFFTNYRKRYNLDEIIKDYELEHGGNCNNSNSATVGGSDINISTSNNINNNINITKMEIDNNNQSTSTTTTTTTSTNDDDNNVVINNNKTDETMEVSTTTATTTTTTTTTNDLSINNTINNNTNNTTTTTTTTTTTILNTNIKSFK